MSILTRKFKLRILFRGAISKIIFQPASAHVLTAARVFRVGTWLTVHRSLQFLSEVPTYSLYL